MCEPSRTEAAKPTHTCGLVDEILIVRMVKVESNPLFCNQRVNLATTYGRILQVHMHADLLQETRQMQPLQLLEGIPCDVLFPALTLEVPNAINRVVAAVVCQGEDVPRVLECPVLRRKTVP